MRMACGNTRAGGWENSNSCSGNAYGRVGDRQGCQDMAVNKDTKKGLGRFQSLEIRIAFLSFGVPSPLKIGYFETKIGCFEMKIACLAPNFGDPSMCTESTD